MYTIAVIESLDDLFQLANPNREEGDTKPFLHTPEIILEDVSQEGYSGHDVFKISSVSNEGYELNGGTPFTFKQLLDKLAERAHIKITIKEEEKKKEAKRQ